MALPNNVQILDFEEAYFFLNEQESWTAEHSAIANELVRVEHEEGMFFAPNVSRGSWGDNRTSHLRIGSSLPEQLITFQFNDYKDYFSPDDSDAENIVGNGVVIIDHMLDGEKLLAQTISLTLNGKVVPRSAIFIEFR